MKKTFQFRLTQTIWEDFSNLCKEQGLKVSECLRMLIRDYIKKAKKK